MLAYACPLCIFTIYAYILYNESRMVWECTFSLFLQNCNHLLKLKLQMKMRSYPLESMYCLKMCPGVHSTFDKCYSVPLTKHNFCRICLQHTVITTFPYLPTNAVCKTEMQHTVLNKCNLPLEQCGVFLQEQYPYKVWSVPLENTPCPLTHISSQRSSIALRKGNIRRPPV